MKSGCWLTFPATVLAKLQKNKKLIGLSSWTAIFGVKKSKKSDNPYEEISEEDIYYDQENKIWLWEVDGHLFSNEEFHMKQGGKIEDFENWIRDKEPIDSIEDVTSYKVH